MKIEKVYEMVSTGFYVGRSRFAPKICASLFAIILWSFINFIFTLMHAPLLMVNIFWIFLFIVATIFGTVSSHFYSERIGESYPREVVIDKICGQLLAILVLTIFSGLQLNFLLSLFLLIIFRFLDHFKPFVIGYVDQGVGGSLGTMLSSLLSGIITTLILLALILSLKDAQFVRTVSIKYFEFYKSLTTMFTS